MSDYELITKGYEKGIVTTKLNNLKLLRNRIHTIHRQYKRKSNFDKEYQEIVAFINQDERYKGGLTYEHLANFEIIYNQYLATKH